MSTPIQPDALAWVQELLALGQGKGNSQTALQTNAITQGEITQTAQQTATEPAPGSLEWVEEVSQLGRDADSVSNQTNAVSKPLSSYPAEKQRSIRSYLGAVDQKIKNFVQKVKSGDLTFKREKISDVSDRAAADIGKLLGIDVSGYTNNINTNGVQHIIDRHGKNGEHDSTMAIDDDIARIGWVLENYDTVELLTENGEQVYSSGFRDSNNRPTPQIRFVKKIDGTHYVVEAACENKYKKLWVQGTYLQKNEDVTQAPAEGQETNHETNAQSDLASPSSINSISQTAPGVNTNSSQAVQPDAFARVQELFALGRGEDPGQTVDTETQAGYDNENDILDAFDGVPKKAAGIKYNNGNSIQLSKSEYAAVTSRISTNYNNDNTGREGIQFVDRSTDGDNAKMYMYLYRDHGFDTYEIIARLDYSRQGELIKKIREVAQNERMAEGTDNGIDTLRSINERIDLGGNSNNDKGTGFRNDQASFGGGGQRTEDNGRSGWPDHDGYDDRGTGVSNTHTQPQTTTPTESVGAAPAWFDVNTRLQYQ